MEKQNNVTEFVLLGLWENKQTELLLCFLFLLCYLAALMGNITILLTITCTHLIEQPMYYFLCHLSLMDLSFSSVVVPQLIKDLASERKIISFNNCMTQLFTFHLLSSMETLILVSMAFDRYVAIVKPLHYMVIMSRQRCNTLIILDWILAFWHAIALLLLVLSLPFCGPNQINHYMCDVKPLLKLACTIINAAGFILMGSNCPRYVLCS
ncbi:olfactory receptor 4P4-like [Dasypus novemcinctus]|uniref:olfactory receptor 4P4-like n=1 Tax=Dasypus novemcinctus TaxID=9361 RepID=UPI00062A8614|nr:olfactory receptor 4P4-like [Dasypus novemcinctus]